MLDYSSKDLSVPRTNGFGWLYSYNPWFTRRVRHNSQGSNILRVLIILLLLTKHRLSHAINIGSRAL